jgi:hypothetical protein
MGVTSNNANFRSHFVSLFSITSFETSLCFLLKNVDEDYSRTSIVLSTSRTDCAADLSGLSGA